VDITGIGGEFLEGCDDGTLAGDLGAQAEIFFLQGHLRPAALLRPVVDGAGRDAVGLGEDLEILVAGEIGLFGREAGGAESIVIGHDDRLGSGAEGVKAGCGGVSVFLG